MYTKFPLGFTGAYRDFVSSGYVLGNGYRWYLPGLMRFNAQDDWSPFGRGGVNPYVYCEADPINFTDPTGHVIDPEIVETVTKLVEDVTAAEKQVDSSLSAEMATQGTSSATSGKRGGLKRPGSGPAPGEPPKRVHFGGLAAGGAIPVSDLEYIPSERWRRADISNGSGDDVRSNYATVSEHAPIDSLIDEAHGALTEAKSYLGTMRSLAAELNELQEITVAPVVGKHTRPGPLPVSEYSYGPEIPLSASDRATAHRAQMHRSGFYAGFHLIQARLLLTEASGRMTSSAVSRYDALRSDFLSLSSEHLGYLDIINQRR